MGEMVVDDILVGMSLEDLPTKDIKDLELRPNEYYMSAIFSESEEDNG